MINKIVSLFFLLAIVIGASLYVFTREHLAILNKLLRMTYTILLAVTIFFSKKWEFTIIPVFSYRYTLVTLFLALVLGGIDNVLVQAQQRGVTPRQVIQDLEPFPLVTLGIAFYLLLLASTGWIAGSWDLRETIAVMIGILLAGGLYLLSKTPKTSSK